MRESSASVHYRQALADLFLRRGNDPRLPPGPAGRPLFGSAVELNKDVLTLLAGGLRDYGDTVRYRFGPFDFFVIHRPEDIRTVLLERADDFRKSPSYDGLRLVVGHGLLTSEGEFWKRQRKLMTPAFHHKRLLDFCAAMVRCASEQADEWDAMIRDRDGDVIVDVHERMLALTFRIVGLTLFSTELSAKADGMGPALATVLEHANHVVMTMFLNPPTWVPTPRNLRFRKALAIVDDVVLGIIAERRRTGQEDPGAEESRGAAKGQEDPGDLLGMLMAATDESGSERMSDQELRDEVATLVLAGHETTAQALTWTFMLLSQHPEIERRVVAEIREVCGDRPPSFEDLKALEYTGRVIDESLRLYPPAWLFERESLVEVELGSYRIPAQRMVAIAPWTLHRHPKFWDNPEGFDPDRFLPDRVAERPRYSYLPFGGGQRQCIGVNFALYEAKLVLATLLQRYSLALVPGQNLRPDASVTLRPKNGLKMWLRPRA
jgi:cytochrome P450